MATYDGYMSPAHSDLNELNDILDAAEQCFDSNEDNMMILDAMEMAQDDRRLDGEFGSLSSSLDYGKHLSTQSSSRIPSTVEVRRLGEFTSIDPASVAVSKSLDKPKGKARVAGNIKTSVIPKTSGNFIQEFTNDERKHIVSYAQVNGIDAAVMYFNWRFPKLTKDTIQILINDKGKYADRRKDPTVAVASVKCQPKYNTRSQKARYTEPDKFVLGAFSCMHGIEATVSEFKDKFNDLNESLVERFRTFWVNNVTKNTPEWQWELEEVPMDEDGDNEVYSEPEWLEIGTYACIYSPSLALSLYASRYPRLTEPRVRLWCRRVRMCVAEYSALRARPAARRAVDDNSYPGCGYTVTDKWEIAEYAKVHGVEAAVNEFKTRYRDLDSKSVATFLAAQLAIVSQVRELETRDATPRVRGQYTKYTAEDRAEIAKYAIASSSTEAARKFRKRFPNLNESSVRNFRDTYRRQTAGQDVGDRTAELATLPTKARGRPRLLGRLDDEVCRNVEMLRAAGGVISRKEVVVAARAVMENCDQGKLREHGGYIDLTKSWAASLLKRMNSTGKSRKGVGGEASIPLEFIEQTRKDLVGILELTAKQYNVPPSLIISCDDSLYNLIPVEGNYTVEVGGATVNCYCGASKKGKRSGTLGIVTTTLDGRFLPMHLVYPGKSKKVHPKYDFPSGFYCSYKYPPTLTEGIMTEFVIRILIPYIMGTRQDSRLGSTQPAIVIYKDGFSERFTKSLSSNHIIPVRLPPDVAQHIQPAALGGGKSLLAHLQGAFQSWYVRVLTEAVIHHGTPIETAQSNIASSIFLREKQSRWISEHYQYMCKRPDLVQLGFLDLGMSCPSPVSMPPLDSLVDDSGATAISSGTATSSQQTNVQNQVITYTANGEKSYHLLNSQGQVTLSPISDANEMRWNELSSVLVCNSDSVVQQPTNNPTPITLVDSNSDIYIPPNILRNYGVRN